MSKANNFTSQSEEEPKKQKRYYWLKLPLNFFDEVYIKRLRKQENGAELVIVFIKLMQKSANAEGVIEFKHYAPTFVEELAMDIDESEENVSAALKLLEEMKRIEQTEAEITICDIDNFVGSMAASTKRSQECRAIKKEAEEAATLAKALQCNTNATLMQHEATAMQHEATQEREIEKDIEIEKEEKDIPAESGHKAKHKDNTDYAGFVSSYHSICTDLPRIRKVEDRKPAIKRAIKLLEEMHTSKEDFFAIVAASDWLNGRTDKPWHLCCFDWIIKPANLTKIIEGNYNNKGSTPRTEQKQFRGTDDIEVSKSSYNLDQFKADALKPVVYSKQMKKGVKHYEAF